MLTGPVGALLSALLAGPAGFWWERPRRFSVSSWCWDAFVCLGTCFFAEQTMGSEPAFTTGFVPMLARINSPLFPSQVVGNRGS